MSGTSDNRIVLQKRTRALQKIYATDTLLDVYHHHKKTMDLIISQALNYPAQINYWPAYNTLMQQARTMGIDESYQEPVVKAFVEYLLPEAMTEEESYQLEEKRQFWMSEEEDYYAEQQQNQLDEWNRQAEVISKQLGVPSYSSTSFEPIGAVKLIDVLHIPSGTPLIESTDVVDAKDQAKEGQDEL